MESNIRPSCQLVGVEFGEQWPNRLGGRPNLPPEIVWPMWEDTPLAFVAQLDLASLPVLAGLELPRTGTLYFFYEGDGYGSEGPPEDFQRVFFCDQPSSGFPLRDWPGNPDQELQLPAIHLSPTPVVDTVPGGEDTLLDVLALSDDERTSYDGFLDDWDSAHPKFAPRQPLPGYPSWVRQPELQHLWDEGRDKNPAIHRIGGYQDCVQFHDPKMEVHLLSRGVDLNAGEETPGLDALRDALNWRLLLQVDSENNTDISWGDSGRLYFLIHKDDLRERRFEKTFVTMQCH
jgi:hypothetical protein